MVVYSGQVRDVSVTTILLYKETDGSVPVKQWLEELKRRNRKAFAKCVERIQRLAALGHELRRSHADIDRAVKRKHALERDPESHIYEDVDNGESKEDL